MGKPHGRARVGLSLPAAPRAGRRSRWRCARARDWCGDVAPRCRRRARLARHSQTHSLTHSILAVEGASSSSQQLQRYSAFSGRGLSLAGLFEGRSPHTHTHTHTDVHAHPDTRHAHTAGSSEARHTPSSERVSHVPAASASASEASAAKRE